MIFGMMASFLCFGQKKRATTVFVIAPQVDILFDNFSLYVFGVIFI